jgi:Xaa-Pro aminopeptidase
MEPLRAGMMLSNEPGYYKAGEYGIRIENLILIEPRAIPGADREMLGFETLTFCPIERTLIEPALLTTEERQWVDDYHAQVLAVLTPEMTDAADRAWLTAKCARLS